jgi:hypothetical protein
MLDDLELKRQRADKQVAANINKYGCHVYSVFDPEGKSPTFTYSIGIQATTGFPEIIVFGLRPELAHDMVIEYLERLITGTRFQRGVLYSGFLNGFQIYLEPTKPNAVKEYSLGCYRYYADQEFSTVQLIFPDTQGIWPWQKTATAAFKAIQPMLGRLRPDRP